MHWADHARGAFLLLLLSVHGLLGFPQTAQARQVVTPGDSLVRQARLAGVAAANAGETWSAFLLAMPGATMLGFGLPIVLLRDDEYSSRPPGKNPGIPLVAVGAVAVVAAYALADRLPAGPPPQDAELLEGRSPEWSRAFLEAYRTRYRERRVKAMKWGSFAGGAAGLGLFFAALGAALGS